MKRLIPMRKHVPAWTRKRGANERIALQLTPAAKRALLLEQVRAGVAAKLHQEN